MTEKRKVARYVIEFEDGYTISFKPEDVAKLEEWKKFQQLLKELRWITEI